MKPLRVLPVALVAMALMLVVASSASAAITATQVDTPTNPTFAIPTNPAQPEYTVDGTATGAAAGEKVDLRCYETATHSVLLSSGIPVEADGSFSVTGVEAESAETCRLRAVPAGTEPTELAELASFTGPVLAIGENRLSMTSTSTLYDFYLYDPQVTAGFDYESIGSCGISDGYLAAEEFRSIATFYCNDWFEGQYGAASNSGFTVGGENAYFSYGADEIDSEAAGFPPLAYSFTQNPLNGDLTVHDSESAVFCPTAEFPPERSECEEFHSSGVDDDRTIEQSHDGHVSVITDQYSSTDGQAHAVEEFPDNEQYFGGHGEQVEYKFPGQSGYSSPTVNQPIGFADSTPGAIYARVAGAPDGDTTTGRGAIVFFQPSSPATVDEVGYVSGFLLDNHVTVPATGTATVKYAYVQAFTQAEVEALVTEVMPPPASTPVTTPPATPISAAASPVKFSFGKLKLAKKKGTATLQVKASGAGTLKLSGKKVKSKTVKVKKAGTVNVAIVPTAATKKALRKSGSANVTVKVSFKGTAGGITTKSRKVRLVLKG